MGMCKEDQHGELAQAENEFGFIGPDMTYMTHMISTIRNYANSVILYTTDPPGVITKGTPGMDQVYA
jgi:beta-galactosidase